MLVLECVPSPLAAAITSASAIPTIGIGAGPGCDGQVLVLHDFLGLDSGHRRPKFVKDFLAEGGSVAGAVRAYADAVRDGSFPDAEHAYAS
jgi:3-methyl-2-oxobutanoate hydroxymethyltransferase